MSEAVSKLWELYQKGVSYQETLGLREQTALNVDFFEGRQWGNVELATKTANLPRPVLNIVKMICRNKKSAVLSTPVRLQFTSSSDSDEQNYGERFTRFCESIQRELRQEDLDNYAMDDGVKKGTYIYHYYWDESARGLLGDYEGGVRGEIIDPLHIFFANPNEKDVQKQKWVMIVRRIEVGEAKDLTDSKLSKELITADKIEDSGYYNETEQEGEAFCTVLTRYFKKGGEVYYEAATKSVMLHEPICLNPKNVMDGKSETDSGENGLGNKAERAEGALPVQEIKAGLYPLSVGVWEKRENSIYGISEIDDLIPNQKAINRTEAVKQLIGQSQSAGKIVVKEGALNGQEITNSPLQVLTDYSANGERGFYTLPVSQVSPIIAGITNDLLQNTRVVAGATEVLSGEVISKSMSGAAIAQLQAQASKPIEEFQKRFFRVREQTGLILSQFLRLYYAEGKAYTYYDPKLKKQQRGEFLPSEYEGQSITVCCKAGAGSVFSDSMTINFLTELKTSGVIDAKTYIQEFPETAIPNKAALLEAITQKQEEQETLNKLQQENAQLQSTIQELQQEIARRQEIAEHGDRLVKENIQVKEYILRLQGEYAQKINLANAEIVKMKEEVMRYGMSMQKVQE